MATSSQSEGNICIRVIIINYIFLQCLCQIEGASYYEEATNDQEEERSKAPSSA